jgi:hypothetical protein
VAGPDRGAMTPIFTVLTVEAVFVAVCSPHPESRIAEIQSVVRKIFFMT